MNPEQPRGAPDHIEQMVDRLIAEAGQHTDAIAERHDRSSERYVQAMKVLERGAAGDTGRIDAVLCAESTGDAYEHEQAVMDAALFIIERYGNPYADGNTPAADAVRSLSARAFEDLLNEEYGYFQKR